MKTPRNYATLARAIRLRESELSRICNWSRFFCISRFCGTCEEAQEKLDRFWKLEKQVEKLKSRIAALPLWRRLLGI